MNLFKRAWSSMSRCCLKTLLLFLTIFFLITLTAISFSIQGTILATETNLRNRIPPITNVLLDEEALAQSREEAGVEWSSFDNIRSTHLHEIAALPYVRDFDYVSWGRSFYSDTLKRVWDADLFLMLDPPIEDATDWLGLSRYGVDFDIFQLKGVRNPNILDIEAGLITLAQGRVFDEEEISNISHVALVSTKFAEVNQLSLGDTFSIDHRFYDFPEISGTPHESENLLFVETLDFEIIGLFEHELAEQVNDFHIMAEHFHILNHIYVPSSIVEMAITDFFVRFWSEQGIDVSDENIIGELFEFENMLFLLHDARYLPNFHAAAAEILPEFWITSDLTHSFADISGSMENLNEIANFVFVGALIASLIVLNLLTLLFLYDRKHEIGIYLALGEKRRNVIFQMLFEVFSISIVAITLALMTGSVVAEGLSRMLIRNDLQRQSEVPLEVIHIDTRTLDGMGFRYEMTHEEMLAAYDVSLDTRNIMMFYGTSTIIIFLSTLLPTLYIVRLNPKKILLQGKIT